VALRATLSHPNIFQPHPKLPQRRNRQGDPLSPRSTNSGHPLRKQWRCKRIGKEGRGVIIPLYRTFSRADLHVMREGLNPQQMEDKWVAFYEEDTLFLHRSWTGLPFAEAKLERKDEGAEMRSFRTPRRWIEGERGIERSIEVFDEVVFGILLSRAPTPADIYNTTPKQLARWAEFGMLRTKAEIDATRGLDTALTTPEEYQEALRKAGLCE